jgi:hypothetical protein
VKDREYRRMLTQLSTAIFHSMATPNSRVFDATGSQYVIEAPCPACEKELWVAPVGCNIDCPSRSAHQACTMCSACGTFLFITPPAFQVMTKEEIAALPPEMAMNLYAQRRALLAR